ncbi:polyprenyl synthetase family protein [Nocardia huaxiensis]|uniref:Polyprenyl synthetase family protein n=1 Tax=Nocardia huaxiensis TaxID=2755382 RepID=A0A7D6VIA2_9NOCA|nr:polyprenyl synthetase family protein [Nocardia huaxiensis]QLY33577.1 polyprenyl synthetase family protein [Nocardia huaxiensis]
MTSNIAPLVEAGESTPDVQAVADAVAAARRAITPVQRAVVDDLAPHLRHMAGYHLGWWDAEGRPTGDAGKALRPALAITCAQAVAGALAWEDPSVINAAVAVELVHDFSLIHDDVMDRDQLRRGRPAAWTVFGSSQAILVGDALLTLANNLLADDPLSGAMTRELNLATLELYAGQSADLAFEERMDVSLAQCLGMAEGKTGALLGASCQLGALAAGADAATAAHYRRFGRQLGLAYQLVDDLMGIWSPPDQTGKPQGSDLSSRKKSLPVVAALTSGTTAGQRLADLYRQPDPFDAATVLEAADLVEAAGGREWASTEAEIRTRGALAALDRARPLESGAGPLRDLTLAILRRDR